MDQVPSEHSEQCALVEWARLQAGKWPELALLFAIPMGGARYATVGAMLRKEGARKGILDLCLPVARKGYHGMYIEMKKRRGGVVSPEQKWWIDALTAQGYKVTVCHGFDAARAEITDYLGGKNAD